MNRRSRRRSFHELVDLAIEACEFSPYSSDVGLTERYRAGAIASAFEVKSRDLLVSLKAVRKDVRHRGADGVQVWLDQHFWEVASLLEHVRAGDAPYACA